MFTHFCQPHYFYVLNYCLYYTTNEFKETTSSLCYLLNKKKLVTVQDLLVIPPHTRHANVALYKTSALYSQIYFSYRILQDEQLRAVLHKLLQRETAAVLQRAHPQERAGALPAGGAQRARDTIRRQPGLYW